MSHEPECPRSWTSVLTGEPAYEDVPEGFDCDYCLRKETQYDLILDPISWDGEQEINGCKHPNEYFSRELCGCDMMHYYCEDCGAQVDECK